MAKVVAIVEGETEKDFVNSQLAAHLVHRGVTMWAILSGKSRKCGGIKEWGIASADIVRELKGGRYCTTMFDYYGMPRSWPGRVESEKLLVQDRACHVEQAVLADITKRIGTSFNSEQFLPYVQMHEFESLIFSDVSVLADLAKALHGGCPLNIQDCLQKILDDAGDPEAINDNYETCPSRRITSLLPQYSKRRNGLTITSCIGLQTLRERCSHFATWLDRLECLGARGN